MPATTQQRPHAAPLGDRDAEDDAIERHHTQHLAEQRELLRELETDPARKHARKFTGVEAEIRGSERALESVARRRASRAAIHTPTDGR